jgi:probable F420-dependent oxidoreductase
MRFWQVLAMTDLEEIPVLAKHAEDLGYEGITLGDHLITFAEQYETYPESEDALIRWYPDTHWPDVMVTFGALAQATTRLKFISSVFVVPMRDPFSIAKGLSTLARLSNDRVILGVGIGWQESEFRLVDRAFAHRGTRTDEMLAVMRLLMSGEMVEYHGRYFDFPRLQMSPGTRKPVPFWIGGHSDAALKRAARHDGWIGAIHDIGQLRHIRGRLAEERAALGRDMQDFGTTLALAGAGTRDADPEPLIREAESLGVTDLYRDAWLDEKGRASRLTLDQKLAEMDRFASRFLLKGS